MHDSLAHRASVQYDPYTPEQQYEIQQVAEAFLTHKKEEIDEISSMRQVKELLSQIVPEDLLEQLKGEMAATRSKANHKKIAIITVPTILTMCWFYC